MRRLLFSLHHLLRNQSIYINWKLALPQFFSETAFLLEDVFLKSCSCSYDFLSLHLGVLFIWVSRRENEAETALSLYKNRSLKFSVHQGYDNSTLVLLYSLSAWYLVCPVPGTHMCR
jgi:hypothetical protein